MTETTEEKKKEKKYLVINGILEVTQPIGSFYVGVVKAAELLKVTHEDPRKYNVELDNYAGIQREIQPDKIDELKQFIKTSDATFPNAIIAALHPGKFELVDRTLKIEIDPDSISIIDGQHRLASFRKEETIGKDFDLLVTFFNGIDLEEQAYLFSIINLTQKKLNPSLVIDLTELFTITTPEKFAHNLATIFNTDEDSPWYHKIKMLGKREEAYAGVISQYTFTKAILRLMCKEGHSSEIRDILKKSKDNRAKLAAISMDPKEYVFWTHYINEEDHIVYEILKDYFLALKKVFSNEWGSSSSVLTKTTGYFAFLRFLKDLYHVADKSKKEKNLEYFEEHLNKVKSIIQPLTSDNFPAGKQGEDLLYAVLKKSLS